MMDNMSRLLQAVSALANGEIMLTPPPVHLFTMETTPSDHIFGKNGDGDSQHFGRGDSVDTDVRTGVIDKMVVEGSFHVVGDAIGVNFQGSDVFQTVGRGEGILANVFTPKIATQPVPTD